MPELDPRVLMAAERTLLAWIRTGVTLMGFGFIVARFGLFLRELAAVGERVAERQQNVGVSAIIGTTLVLLGAVAVAVALVDHAREVRRYERGLPCRGRLLSPVTFLAATLSVAGVGLSIYLVCV